MRRQNYISDIPAGQSDFKSARLVQLLPSLE